MRNIDINFSLLEFWFQPSIAIGFKIFSLSYDWDTLSVNIVTQGRYVQLELFGKVLAFSYGKARQ